MEKVSTVKRILWGGLFITAGFLGTLALLAHLTYFVVLIMNGNLSNMLPWIGILFFKACGLAVAASILGIVGVPVIIVWLYGVLYSRGEETNSFRDFFRDSMLAIMK